MHHQPVFSLSRILRALACAATLALLAGCDMKITDLTPKVLPENPSRIYTLALRAAPKTQSVSPSSIRARIVVDGLIHEMKSGGLGVDIYEYDFQLPAGRDELAYYYIVDYAIEHGGGITRKQTYTDVTRTRVVGRYVFTLETNRGPVGAKIAVVGRGFSSTDVVKFDDQPVQTINESANSLHFIVPAVETGRNYRVTLEGNTGSSPIGTFRVDPAVIDSVASPFPPTPPANSYNYASTTYAPAPAAVTTYAAAPSYTTTSYNSAPATTYAAPAYTSAPGLAAGSVSASPADLWLSPGISQAVTFTLSTPAPASGQLLDVTTDIPTSVIMPEVLIPAGERSVTVYVTGGQPGKGNLFYKGGSLAGETAIPVRVE